MPNGALIFRKFKLHFEYYGGYMPFNKIKAKWHTQKEILSSIAKMFQLLPKQIFYKG